jgi:hypothetical protein
MRRRTLLVALVGLGVVVAAGVVAPPPSPPVRIDADINLSGRTAGEVIAMFGYPPGDYTTGPRSTWRSIKRTAPPGGSVLEWMTDEKDIGVIFDASGRVESVDSYPVTDGSMSYAYLRYRIKRRWHRWFP